MGLILFYIQIKMKQNKVLIVILLLLLSFLASGACAQQKAIKILAIGNSFSQDAVEQYLYELANAEGIPVIIGNMYIAGCSLERHVKNARSNDSAYAYRKISLDGKKSGAMALFGEKYGDTVRVVSMGDFSKELCGGTHVKHTGEIGYFKILSESGVAAGVRRIEALTGANVMAYYQAMEENFNKAAAAAKAAPAALTEKIQHMQAELKALNAENESLKAKMAQSALGNVMDQAVEVKGTKLLATSVDGVDMNGLRDLGDQLKDKIGEGVVVLLSAQDGKVNMIAMATDGAVKAGAHAGNLIKGIAALVGGGGGGRPNMAQAGGKNPAGIPAAIAEASKVLEGQLA